MGWEFWVWDPPEEERGVAWIELPRQKFVKETRRRGITMPWEGEMVGK